MNIPSAIASPARSCNAIVATSAGLGTPNFDIAEAALSKFARLVAAHEKRIAAGLSAAEMPKLIELLEKVRDKANA